MSDEELHEELRRLAAEVEARGTPTTEDERQTLAALYSDKAAVEKALLEVHRQRLN